MKADITEKLELAQGVSAAVENGIVRIKGPKGELIRKLSAPGIRIKAEGQTVTLTAKKATRHEKKMLYTFLAHIRNMARGTQQPWTYRLKICSGHFPMTATISGNKFSIKNFLGEKVPRECRLPEDAEVKISGQEITITSADRETAGRVAGRLELLTFKPNKDQRTFQDGIYITEKPSRNST
jgi:large subunit ribosomal protein L6